MNILILNWRDPKNARSGGAEKLNYQILKPLLERQHRVVWYAMAASGLPKNEIYKGITIVRTGNLITHFLLWPFFLWTGKFGRVDYIIDSIHGIGYLSPLFAPRTKKIILICEVAQNIWNEMWPFPISILGKIFERFQFFFYKKNDFWTISDSTKKDLVTFGISSKKITILPMGYDAVELKKIPAKTKYPSALFVGRLAEVKGVRDAIQAIAEINKTAKFQWVLNIVGRGDKKYTKQLMDLIKEEKLSKVIFLHGFVSEKEKFEYMARAWVLLVPSSREGWGMIVGEANYVGTQVIGYNVPGLRDSLSYYSRSNISVENNYLMLKKAMVSIQKPIHVRFQRKPGWKELEKEVLKNIS